jgi:hypothetical protein
MTNPSYKQTPRLVITQAGIIIIFLIFFIVLVPGVQGADTNITDNTYCENRFNLALENKVNISVPTVVDINVRTGNLLVRGQVPLVVRDGPDNSVGCRMHSDWYYAYDGLNVLMQDKKDFVPAYFNEQNHNVEKKAALQNAMKNFSLDDYEIIDIALLNAIPTDTDMKKFTTITNAFEGTYSTCNATLKDTTFHGRNGSLVLSNFYFCDTGDGASNPNCTKSIVADIVNSGTCSYSSRIDQIIALMAGAGQTPGTKRFIYLHCSRGIDRTGSVTMGYLQKTIPGMSYVHALNFAQNLGIESKGNDAMWPLGYGTNNASLAYCQYIGADCTVTENVRIMLPGSDTHSHLPGQEDPIITISPTPDMAAAPTTTGP